MMCAMDLKLSATYDASPAEVFAIISDPSFRETACEQTHALSYDVSVTDDGPDVVIRVAREMPTDQVPDFAKKFVGSTITVIQTETWHPAAGDGSRTADVQGEIKGTPAAFTGTASITGKPGDTVQSVDLDVKVSVPLIGKKIEPFIAKAIEAALSKEHKLGQSWHDERP
jgi:uncharacterized protein DUF2505